MVGCASCLLRRSGGVENSALCSSLSEDGRHSDLLICLDASLQGAFHNLITLSSQKHHTLLNQTAQILKLAVCVFSLYQDQMITVRWIH